MKYKRTATVEFALNGTEERVTVSNLPYVWNTDLDTDIEAPAVYKAIDFLRSVGVTRGLDLISVCTSRA